jgi:hypothetical protein
VKARAWIVAGVLGVASSVGCSHVGAPCAFDGDCAGDEACVYAIADGCAAKTTCQKRPTGAICNSAFNYCGCDGQTIAIMCRWAGSSLGPVSGPGTCPPSSGDGGVD